MGHKYLQGVYYPKNGKKYIGSSYPAYRSSWELKIFKYLDESKSVLSWASEPIKIPYQHPFTGKICNYIPDLMIKYVDRLGNENVELVEIKPLKETFLEATKSRRDKLAFTVNSAKWQQAKIWCKNQGIKFRVITENDIFNVKR